MNIEDIVSEIEKLEQSDSNWNNVQRLSWLYTVRDHMAGDQPRSEEPIVTSGSSVFLQSVGGKNAGSVMKVIDEMMEATQILNPKLYENVLIRINEL